MAFWTKKEDESPTTSEPTGSTASRESKEATSSSRPLSEPTVVGGAGAVATAPSSKETAASSQEKSTSFSCPEDSIADRFGKVRSALGPGTVIQGKLSFDTPVRIDGKLSGEIFSSKALIIGEQGEVDATVEVACLIILGKMTGKVKATEKIELYGSGSLEGDIKTPAFAMQEGAHFSGKCHMGHSSASPQAEATGESIATSALEAKAEKKGGATKKGKASPAGNAKEEAAAAQAVH